jgi:hypothetical protein
MDLFGGYYSVYDKVKRLTVQKGRNASGSTDRIM